MKDLEKVVGLQTDKPLKRAFMPYCGIKMAEQAAATYGYEPDEKLHEIFTKYHKTHNQAVFDVYTPEIKKAWRVYGLRFLSGCGKCIHVWKICSWRDRKSTRLNSSHVNRSRMPSSA